MKVLIIAFFVCAIILHIADIDEKKKGNSKK